TTVNSAGITTAGGSQLYDGNLTLGAASVTFDTTGGGNVGGADITVGGNITGSGDALVLDGGDGSSATTVTVHRVGTLLAPLSAFTIDAQNATLLGSVFATSQTYNANVTIGGSANLVLGAGGTLAFGKDVTLTSSVTFTADA